MKRILISICLMPLISTAASAEFTPAEKEQILRLRSIGDEALILAHLATQELYLGTDRAVDPYALAVAKSAQDLHKEQYNALSNLIGSLTTDIPGNNPLSEKLTPESRVTRAKFYLPRIHPYRTGQIKTALDAAIAAGATRVELTTYAQRALDRIVAAHAALNLDLESGFVTREPSWWPFLVRRASDGLGLHGHFEVSTETIAQGKGYTLDALAFATRALQEWHGEIHFDARKGLRGYANMMRFVIRDLEDAQLATFGVGSAGDEFTRLFLATQDALIGAGKVGLRGAQRFGLRQMLIAAIKNGQTATAAMLDQATDGLADGWGLAVDDWTWQAIRFPCIEGFESRGCQDGFPVEPLLP